MKKFIGMAVFAGILTAVSSCGSKPVEPKPKPIGDYVGWYTYEPDNQTATEQPITWRFSHCGYNMWFDAERADTLGMVREFCDVAGTYELENGVILNQLNENVGGDQCDPSMNPQGFFHLDLSTDTLRMTQYDDQEHVTKTLKLFPKE
jgi:hypothetical protein